MAVVLPIVMLSCKLLFVTVIVTVIVEASVMETDAALMLRLAVKLRFGVWPVLNSNPAGAFSTNVTFVPIANSPLPPSARVIAPRLVQAGAGAFAAVSAGRLPPPDAPVIVRA